MYKKISRNSPNDSTFRKHENAWENLKLEVRRVSSRSSVNGTYATGSKSYRKTDIKTLSPFLILLFFFLLFQIYFYEDCLKKEIFPHNSF